NYARPLGRVEVRKGLKGFSHGAERRGRSEQRSPAKPGFLRSKKCAQIFKNHRNVKLCGHIFIRLHKLNGWGILIVTLTIRNGT
ncbi:MAG: hypothetical protein LBK61_01770, partial [Spirochaetaceae bacterium]|nr:hypothetical protein [Spirochaetaceae bacterium]